MCWDRVVWISIVQAQDVRLTTRTHTMQDVAALRNQCGSKLQTVVSALETEQSDDDVS
jgi:hypothetical protein